MFSFGSIGVRLRGVIRLVLGAIVVLPAALTTERTLLPDPKQVRTVGPFIHDVWRIEDGLPENSITAIAQTHDGYLWLATFDGLVRFDGARFTVFDPSNTKEMKTSRWGGLFVDRGGALWIFPDRSGSESAPIVYSEGRFKAFPSGSGLPARHVLSVQEDRETGMWFKTEGNQLVRFNGGRFTILDAADGIPAATIGKVQADGIGNVWIGTDRGLLRFSGGRYSRYTTKDGLPSDVIGPLAADTAGNMWIGTNHGLARFSGGQFTVYGVREGLQGNVVDHIHTCRDGAVWIATEKGLTRFSSGRFVVQRLGPKDVAIAEIREDATGGLWIRPGRPRWHGQKFLDASTFPTSSTLYLYRDGKIATYDARAGLSDHAIYSLYADREGSLWIGRSGAGLERLRPSFLASYAREDGLPNENARSVLEASDGSLWIGTQGGGLARLKDEKITTYTKADGLPSDLVWSVAEDGKHNIWAGTQRGLARFAGGKFTVDRISKAFAGQPVLCLLETRDAVCIAGRTGGWTTSRRKTVCPATISGRSTKTTKARSGWLQTTGSRSLETGGLRSIPPMTGCRTDL